MTGNENNEVKLARIVAEVPDTLKEKAMQRAKRRGLNLKDLIIVLLEKEVETAEAPAQALAS